MSLISSRIARQEQKARTEYLSAVQQIGTENNPDGFSEFIQQNVLPALIQMGFEKEIARCFFRISSQAWKPMAAATGTSFTRHAALKSDIQKIRSTMLAHDENRLEQPSASGENSPLKFVEMTENGYSRDSLSEYFQAIPSTWIILPRAHSFLSKEDSHCLVFYLKHLERETCSVFKKILARIVIEFIGNYSLKFINSNLPGNVMPEVIFYGYAAMFWKNLRQPPPGLEHLLIFNCYLSWMKNFMRRDCCMDNAKKVAIAEMEDMVEKILPCRHELVLSSVNKRDVSCLQISLRHGRPGIDHVLRNFTMDRLAMDCNTQNENYCRTLPKKINFLFRVIRENYEQETPETRNFIHVFLQELETVYNPLTSHANSVRQNLPANLVFTHGRMSGMVKDFSRSFH